MMKEISLTRKILLGIISSPLFVMCLGISLVFISLLWIVLPFALLFLLIDFLKGEVNIWDSFFGFIKRWCLIGLHIYFNFVWDYDLFDF